MRCIPFLSQTCKIFKGEMLHGINEEIIRDVTAAPDRFWRLRSIRSARSRRPGRTRSAGRNEALQEVGKYNNPCGVDGDFCWIGLLIFSVPPLLGYIDCGLPIFTLVVCA